MGDNLDRIYSVKMAGATGPAGAKGPLWPDDIKIFDPGEVLLVGGSMTLDAGTGRLVVSDGGPRWA